MTRGIRTAAWAVKRWKAPGKALAAGTVLALLFACGQAGADPRIKSVREGEATGDVFRVYAPFKAALGFVPNEYEAMSGDLSLLRLHAAFTHALIDSTRHLTPQQKAMIGLVVGTAVSSDYLRQLESWQLARLGLKEDQVRRIQQDYQSAGLKSNEVAALKFAQKMSTSPAEMAEQDFSDLRWDGWTDPEILEIAMITSFYGYLARMAQVLAIEPDTYPEVKR